MDLRTCHECYHSIIAILLCASTGIVSSEHRCMPGIDFKGYTVPSGDILIEYGNPLDIMCVLVNSTKNMLSPNASLNLSFIKNNETIPPEMIKVINDTAIRLHIENPPKVKSDNYICVLNVVEPICSNLVTVGTKPKTVTDFNCISYNYDNLTCTWTAPQNYIRTDYELTYTLQGRSLRGSACPLLEYVTEVDRQMRCIWNVSTTPHYRQVHDAFNFTLTMKNAFGTNQLNHPFRHFAHVLSGPPENLKVVNKTSSSLNLTWTVPVSMQPFPPGVHHRIYYQCVYYDDKKWHFGGILTDTKKYGKEGNFLLRNLKYAYDYCDIRVSLRSAAALYDDESMWSNNASITERTSSKIPDEPPETTAGSFEIVSYGHSLEFREAYIYWKQIREDQKNGPEFRYMIAAEEDPNNKPVEVSNIYAKFKNLSIGKDYTFHIWSQNIDGSSARKSVVRIPKQADRVKEPLSFTKVEFTSGNYDLTWEAPILGPGQRITNYTIFQCSNDRDRPYQCNGMLNYTVVPSNTTTLNMVVAPNTVFQFAISANSEHSSSGMLWAACTVIHDKNMGKLKNVWINSVWPTAIDVSWKLDCSDRIGSVEAFIVYYCPIKSPTMSECKAPQANTTFNGSTVQSGRITNLSPYTTYMLTVAVRTKNTTYSQQSDPLYNTTLEAKPSSPPRNLKIANVTNSSVFVSWEPPEATNGVLRFYELEYTNRNTTVKEVVNHGTNITLGKLKSYEKYSIILRGCTVACSENSEIVDVTTRMGYPDKITKPTVNHRNDTTITVTWNEPSKPAGKNDYYIVRVKQKYKGENRTLEYNTTERRYVIENCGDRGKYNTFYISVKVVNLIDYEVYSSPWSDELENYCDNPGNYIIYALLFVTLVILGLIGYLFTKIYQRYKLMRDVEVKLPPGLAPVVADHTLVPWSTEKHQEIRDSHAPPDEELLLVKMSEGRHFSGDSSGCSSGNESVTSSLDSGANSNDTDTDKNVDYKMCEPPTESSPYVLSGEPIKVINPGYIPFNQAEPAAKASGYVVAGMKNCNGYIPFNQPEPVVKSSGYVVAGVKN